LPWTKKSPLKRISAVIGKSPKKKRREEEASNHEMMMARMAQLEKENKNLANRNQELERTYHDFQAKSETMERLLGESMARDAIRAKEELEWIKARERRIKEQTLVASPLSKHMAALDRTGNMSTIGQVSSMKQPFQLALPSERRKKEDEILISLNRAISPLRESDDDNTQLMNENADPQKPKMKKEGSNTSMKRKSTTGEMTSPTSKKSRMDQHELFFLGKFAGK
jgi:predicted RNase H-like nuclease (RuvC/YqgF family)